MAFGSCFLEFLQHVRHVLSQQRYISISILSEIKDFVSIENDGKENLVANPFYKFLNHQFKSKVLS
jgi:hypothetical protein